jgi:hypothetical protein
MIIQRTSRSLRFSQGSCLTLDHDRGVFRTTFAAWSLDIFGGHAIHVSRDSLEATNLFSRHLGR